MSAVALVVKHVVKQMMDNKLTSQQVADMLGITVGTLAVWRCIKRYPLAYMKVGSKVYYRSEDVEKFIASRTHSGVQ